MAEPANKQTNPFPLFVRMKDDDQSRLEIAASKVLWNVTVLRGVGELLLHIFFIRLSPVLLTLAQLRQPSSTTGHPVGSVKKMKNDEGHIFGFAVKSEFHFTVADSSILKITFLMVPGNFGYFRRFKRSFQDILSLLLPYNATYQRLWR